MGLWNEGQGGHTESRRSVFKELIHLHMHGCMAAVGASVSTDHTR